MKNKKLSVITAAAVFIGCAVVYSAPVPAQEVSNDSFTVTVPDEIAEICEVETNTDSISFYEPISHKEYHGGFVGDIRLFESVRDYGNLPNYRRGGQIDLPDGTKKDVVLELPSDVQFDVQNEESKENYGRISDALLSEIAASIVPADGVFTPQDEVDTTGIYADVLDKLRADLEEEADNETLDNDGFSYLYKYFYQEEDPAGMIGYLYLDINCDGYDELLIGSVEENAIYDLFTQLDNEVIHVISGGERDIFTLMGANGDYHRIKETGSGGADLTNVIFYDLDPARAVLNRQVAFTYDGQKDAESAFSIEYGEEEDAETATEEEWNERISSFGEEMQIQFTPLQ